jgi:hypothetical protein
MSRHRAIRNLDLDGDFLLSCVLNVVEYLDDDNDEFSEDEGNGLIRCKLLN